MTMSPQKRQEIIDALRRGTVPGSSLDAFAVGLERFEATLDEELRKVSAGGSMFKAVRGEYGCGKTFLPAGWQMGIHQGGEIDGTVDLVECQQGAKLLRDTFSNSIDFLYVIGFSLKFPVKSCLTG
jgi:P-loop Domain of unknown function (DUF2791)